MENQNVTEIKDTLEIEVSETFKSKKQVKLPYFSSNGCHWYKVVNVSKTILVKKVSDDYFGIEVYTNALGAFNSDAKEITEQEFNDKLNEIKALL